jgi:hypothetical protein
MVLFMKRSWIIVLLIVCCYNANAQKSNAEKIIGCWIFKKIEFINPNEFSEEIIKEAKNTEVCFDTNGKFTTIKPGANTATITGVYSLSADEKTLSQKRDVYSEGIDEDAEIIVLDAENLTFKLEFGTMHLERKK